MYQRKSIILFFVTCFFLSVNARAQDPDAMKLEMRNNINNVGDCAITVSISRKDKTDFSFPKNYSFDNESVQDGDLIIFIEKKNGNNYEPWLCNQVKTWHPTKSHEINFSKFREVTAKDALSRIGCLPKGEYRLRIGYNKRPVNGAPDEQNMVCYSNWENFTVQHYLDLSKPAT